MLQQSTQCMTIRHSFKKKTMKHSMTRLLRRRRRTRRSPDVNYSTSWKTVREATDTYVRIHHSDVSFHSHDAGSGVLPARDQCLVIRQEYILVGGSIIDSRSSPTLFLCTTCDRPNPRKRTLQFITLLSMRHIESSCFGLKTCSNYARY